MFSIRYGKSKHKCAGNEISVLQNLESSAGVVIGCVMKNGKKNNYIWFTYIDEEWKKLCLNGEEKEVKIVFGVEKYNQFPLGRHFASITIDKPLLYLCPKLLILILRIPRQIVFFSHNHYMIEYRSSKQYVLTRLAPWEFIWDGKYSLYNKNIQRWFSAYSKAVSKED